MGFDAKTFISTGGSANLGTQLGVPSCMLNLAADVLGLIPSPILLAMRHSLAIGRGIADGIIKRINSFIRDLLGISLFPNRDGFFGYFSDFSRMGLDVISGITSVLGTFIGFAQAAAAAFNELKQRYESAKECLEQYKQYLDYSNGGASQRREELATANPEEYQRMIDSQFGVYFRQAQQAQDLLNQFDRQIAIIDDIILQRTLDPTLEPNIDEIPIAKESVFRLEAGPPRSKTGKFVLSIDGLYYDSQVSGIEPALLELADRSTQIQDNLKWKLEFDPSLGGRGIPTTSKDLKYYFDSILNPEIIDDSKVLEAYYEKDELLLNIEGQKDRKIFDVSSELQGYIDAGAGQAIVENTRQVLIAQSSFFGDKINKRKKQIELAVKVPNILGRGARYLPGEVPINDFSYLEGTNFLMDIQDQRNIVLNQEDVTGVVLPLETKFTDKIDTQDDAVVDHLLLANIAKGEVIDNASAPSAPSLQINTRIIEEDLEILYNYLTAASSTTSGVDFLLRNSSEYQHTHNAQLVGNPVEIFNKGVGVAKLDGICELDTTNNSIASSVGSYIRLPQVPQLQDFMYNVDGSTFETWVYMPDLLNDAGFSVGNPGNSVSSLYRLILANENTGNNPIKNIQDDIENLESDGGITVVRGLIYGFSRDRRLTRNEVASNLDVSNPLSDLALVLAPTQSHDASSVGFVAKRGNACQRDSWRGLKIPVNQTFNGKSLSSCNDEFCQLSVVLNPAKNKVDLYLDGTLIATESYMEVFGTSRVGAVYQCPSVFQPNSFEYNSSSVHVSSVSSLKAGPRLDDYFTPWILGGGYTDGNPNGNFMGGANGGKVSGLRGYLGCTRFYSKPLTSLEVLNNYEATQKFFKNIDVRDIWEPIISE